MDHVLSAIWNSAPCAHHLAFVEPVRLYTTWSMALVNLSHVLFSTARPAPKTMSALSALKVTAFPTTVATLLVSNATSPTARPAALKMNVPNVWRLSSLSTQLVSSAPSVIVSNAMSPEYALPVMLTFLLLKGCASLDALRTVQSICALTSLECVSSVLLASPSTESSTSASTAQSLIAIPAKPTTSVSNALRPSLFSAMDHADVHRELLFRTMALFADVPSTRPMMLALRPRAKTLAAVRVVVLLTALAARLMRLACLLVTHVFSAMSFSTMVLPAHYSARSLAALSASLSTTAAVAIRG